MSRIFDALRTSRSKVQSLDIGEPGAAQELLQLAEKEQSQPVELAPSFPCHKCRLPVPDDSLFCTHCDAFQGSSVSDDYTDEP
jgi:hypothetical protein